MLWLFPFAFLPLPRLTTIASRQLPSQGNIRFLSYLPFPPSPSTAGEELFRDSATGVRYLSIESTVTGRRRTTTAADYQIKGHAVEDNSSAGWGCSPPKRRRFLSSQIAMAGLGSSSSEIDLDHPNIEEYLTTETIREAPKKLHLRDLLDISPTLTEAAGAVVDDSFTRCFKSNPPEPWNWNVYLFPLWCLGVVVRYGILFPLRVAIVAAGWIAFFSAFFPVHFLLRGHKKWRLKIERKLVGMMCSVFVASWTGVIKYHGPRPSIRPQQVFVANHTSMIDFVILEQMTAFAVIMQKHPGWVGFIQKTILESVGCIWFNRTEAKDREIVARKIREHTQGVDNNPLLIFPEGTCVNNHYTVMFKKGAFELGCAVCPVAIKYNKIFVDAFWNSKKQSFTMHLVRLMTSWAVVCDVWYLEPQYIRPGETPIEFAERVRDMISVRAGLKKVPWDGYLKYFRPSPKLRECKQQIFAESVLQRLEEK